MSPSSERLASCTVLLLRVNFSCSTDRNAFGRSGTSAKEASGCRMRWLHSLLACSGLTPEAAHACSTAAVSQTVSGLSTRLVGMVAGLHRQAGQAHLRARNKGAVEAWEITAFAKLLQSVCIAFVLPTEIGCKVLHGTITQLMAQSLSMPGQQALITRQPGLAGGAHDKSEPP